MPPFRISLFTRTIVWFFLNLLFIAVLLWLISLSSWWARLPNSPRFDANRRIVSIASLLVEELRNKTTAERDAILQRYSDAYQVQFSVYDNDTGNHLGGDATPLPDAMLAEIRRPPPGPRPESGEAMPPRSANLPPNVLNIFSVTTDNPRRYWLGARVPIFNQNNAERIRATLFVSSDSISGNGLFFDPYPWLLLGGVIVAASILFWLPFVGHLTRFIAQMTRATEQIAEEHFDVRVNERRTDELGRLGKAINHMAMRLSGFVTGQRRFLGDISHELNTPLARMQFALAILEDRVPSEQRRYVTDVQEEVQLMSKLASELLDYSKAGLKAHAVKLESVNLHDLAQQVVARETAGREEAAIALHIDQTLVVQANAALLARALGNVLRNALHYASAAGPITLSAQTDEAQVALHVIDYGPGVPAAALDKLFDPFYRLETDRARETGGTGLGLAIVKSCVEACQGSVTARNRLPHGLEVIFTLPASPALSKSM
jgi:two-component system, OmpR family, sensor histidine kinase CpxA